jgi:hypothetical protein
MQHEHLRAANVLSWSCPVPVFGNLEKSSVATVGINPSNLEFADAAGNELNGSDRRFPTLKSLRLSSWASIKKPQLYALTRAYEEYFFTRPYRKWFDVLDDVIAGTGASFYGSDEGACHLDLVPYATATKWGRLKAAQKRELLHRSQDLIGRLVSASCLKLLVLNGMTVIRAFGVMTPVQFTVTRQPAWDLPRVRAPVRGFSYQGIVCQIGGVMLERPITVVGFNHNLQSSYGITTGVKRAIKSWIGRTVGEIKP